MATKNPRTQPLSWRSGEPAMARVLSELRVLVHELALNDDVVEVLLPIG